MFLGGGAGGGTRTPTGRARRIFLPSTAFAAAGRTSVWGLDYPFTMPAGCPVGLGAARLVSTPSAISCGLARDYQLKGFPEFEQFYFGDFPPSTQFGLSPLRLPFRHARTPRGVIGMNFSLAKTDKAEISQKYFC